MDEYLNFFSIDVWTIIFTWGNLAILMLILKKLLFKPVMKVLDERQKELDDIYQQANEANAKAQGLEQEYSQKMALARDEAGEIIKTATQSAQKREEEIITNAKNEADRILDKASREIEQEKKKAYQDIKEDISEISVAIAEKIVGKELSADDHLTLIEEFIENVGEENE